MNYIIKPAASLFIAAAITVAALSFVYNKTYESIEKQKNKAQEKAMREIFMYGTYTFKEVPFSPTKSINAVYEVYSLVSDFNPKKAGYILKLSTEGYSGPIEFIIGFGIGNSKEIKGIRILRQSETPGLGALSVKYDFYGQFSGKRISPLKVTKSSPNSDEIQAITSATITSRAITNAVNEAIEWYFSVEGQPKVIEDDEWWYSEDKVYNLVPGGSLKNYLTPEELEEIDFHPFVLTEEAWGRLTEEALENLKLQGSVE
jgi:Na+-translocating ferredoxin:NAD+ oxidoreductase subunit G